MKRPSLHDIEVAAVKYRQACVTGDSFDFIYAHRRLAWNVCLSLYSEKFCQRRCRGSR